MFREVKLHQILTDENINIIFFYVTIQEYLKFAFVSDITSVHCILLCYSFYCIL